MADPWKTVLVTGGIGSGKSTVCKYLEACGVPVYDCDAAARRLYDERPGLVPAIEGLLGLSVSSSDGRLDRAALASVIFSGAQALAAVESVIHPAVLEDFLIWKKRRQESGKHQGKQRRWDADLRQACNWCCYAGSPPFVVMESAIALEKPLFRGHYDAVVLVTAPEEVRLGRVALRSGADLTDEAVVASIRSRMAAQSYDPAAATAVIDNASDIALLREKCDEAFRRVAAELE